PRGAEEVRPFENRVRTEMICDEENGEHRWKAPTSFRGASATSEPGLQGSKLRGSGFRARAHSASQTHVNALRGAPRNDAGVLVRLLRSCSDNARGFEVRHLKNKTERIQLMLPG